VTPALLAPEQAALALNVSRDRLLALVRAGTIAAVRLGPRTIRVPSSEIDRLAGEALASRHAEAEGARERRGQRVPRPKPPAPPAVARSGHGRLDARYAATKAEAKTALRELLRERDLGLAGPDSTLSDYLAGWLATLDIAPRTRMSYAHHIEAYWTPMLGDRRIRALTAAEVRVALAQVARAPRHPHPHPRHPAIRPRRCGA
jgi:excisionase family DNA binding protein